MPDAMRCVVVCCVVVNRAIGCNLAASFTCSPLFEMRGCFPGTGIGQSSRILRGLFCRGGKKAFNETMNCSLQPRAVI